MRNCGHTGRLGHCAEVAAGSDIATIIAAAAATTGGRSPARRNHPKLATNPWPSVPGTDAGPIVVDFATAAAAGGRVMVAKKRGERPVARSPHRRRGADRQSRRISHRRRIDSSLRRAKGSGWDSSPNSSQAPCSATTPRIELDHRGHRRVSVPELGVDSTSSKRSSTT